MCDKKKCKGKNGCRCTSIQLTKGTKGEKGDIGPVGPNGWKLNGNTEGSEKYFGTNDNFDIPIYTNGNKIGVFSKNGNFAFGNILPTSRLGIQAIDSTSSNFALKVDNSANSPLLYVRNDGFVGIGTSNTVDRLTIYAADVQGISLYNSANNNLQHKMGTSTVFGGYYEMSNSSGVSVIRLSTLDSYVIGNNFGIGTITPTAKVHIKGIDSTSSNYALKVDNLASSPLLYVRNDGNVGIGTATPATSALLDLTSTTGALLVTRMTTTEKNALTAVNGMILYDTTLNKFQGYEAGAWTNLI